MFLTAQFITYVIYIAVPGGGQKGNCPPKFLKFGRNSNFSASDKKIFGQNQNSSGSDMNNLSKVTNFRSAIMTNCKKYCIKFR